MHMVQWHASFRTPIASQGRARNRRTRGPPCRASLPNLHPLQKDDERLPSTIQRWARSAVSTLICMALPLIDFPLMASSPCLASDMVVVDEHILQWIPPLPTHFPPLPELNMANFNKHTLPSNKMRLVMLEDHEAPIVRGILLLKGGQRASPPSKVGLATLSAAVQRSGGSIQHPKTAFDDELEDLAATIEGGAGPDAISFGFSCLAEDTTQVLSLLSELILSPAIPEDSLELFKSQMVNSLAHRNDDITGIPVREAAKLVYGRDSPYVREPTISDVKSISVEDVKSWLSEWERPDTAVLGLTGNFSSAEMMQTVEEAFGNWEARGSPTPVPRSPVPSASAASDTQARVFFVDVPGSFQSSIAIAELGIQLQDPDDTALDVVGGILNSFGGRLFDGIRSQKGLAYSVTAGWQSAPVDHPGLFLAAAETADPGQLLVTMQNILNEVCNAEPSKEEVARAKDEALNSSVFQFSSNIAQLRRMVGYELLGVDPEYVVKYLKKLSMVTPADVQAAAKRHLHPDKQVVVVVGDGMKVRNSIEQALGVKVQSLQLKTEGEDSL
jgi:zinc protease